MALERSNSPLQYGLILFVVIGFVVQNLGVYWAFSRVPKHFLPSSYIVSTLQCDIYLLPTYAVLLTGIVIFGSDCRRQALIQRYADSGKGVGSLFLNIMR